MSSKTDWAAENSSGNDIVYPSDSQRSKVNENRITDAVVSEAAESVLNLWKIKLLFSCLHKLVYQFYLVTTNLRRIGKYLIFEASF